MVHMKYRGWIDVTPLKIMMGAVALFALLLTFALSRVPAEKQAHAAIPSEKFDEAWSDVLRPLSSEGLRKADMERIFTTDPKPVVTERIVVEPVASEDVNIEVPM